MTATDLRTRLYALADSVPGTVGIAFVSHSDTVTVNNSAHYPMMSVFKLHQSLAVADELTRRGTTLDSLITVTPDELDRATWSPMLTPNGGPYSPETPFSISVGQLVGYALTSSDNNASNILFRRIADPQKTDAFIRSVAPDTTFRIRWSEAEMHRDHELSYSNYTTPLSAALLIRRVFTTGILAPEPLNFIRSALCAVTTGQDRLGAPVAGSKDIVFGHKTGSGYRNAAGELAAHNDVGYFRLPDGRDYALAVLIRDFSGTEMEASAIIARISSIVYEYNSQSTVKAPRRLE